MNEAGALIEVDVATERSIQVWIEPGIDRTAQFVASLGRKTAELVIGADQGEHSGDTACVMRYSNSRAYGGTRTGQLP